MKESQFSQSRARDCVYQDTMAGVGVIVIFIIGIALVGLAYIVLSPLVHSFLTVFNNYEVVTESARNSMNLMNRGWMIAPVAVFIVLIVALLKSTGDGSV